LNEIIGCPPKRQSTTVSSAESSRDARSCSVYNSKLAISGRELGY
jgi:hypothetical protein